MRIITTVLPCCSLVGCAGRDSFLRFLVTGHGCPVSEYGTEPITGQFSGVLDYEFEGSSFELDGRNRTVWLAFSDEKLLKLMRTYPKFRARVTVIGTLSSPGRHGHMGMWERRLVVTEVLSSELIGGTPWFLAN